MSDQAIINSLRLEKRATEIRALGISMKRVRSLCSRGQVARRVSGEFRVNRSYKFYVYRTVVSDQFQMPFRCSGSTCRGQNIHGDRRHKLCKMCRDAKLRHNKSERSRPGNVIRANRTRQVLRYNRAVQRLERRGGPRPWNLQGLKLFTRCTGFSF